MFTGSSWSGPVPWKRKNLADPNFFHDKPWEREGGRGRERVMKKKWRWKMKTVASMGLPACTVFPSTSKFRVRSVWAVPSYGKLSACACVFVLSYFFFFFFFLGCFWPFWERSYTFCSDACEYDMPNFIRIPSRLEFESELRVVKSHTFAFLLGFRW